MPGPASSDAGEHPRPAPRLNPFAALMRAVLPAARRPPCLVSFSGGRDSSIVLAAAARAARDQGLDLPVPITLRFADAPGSEESRWQEGVVRHLGLRDWEVIQVSDETDFIGPMSSRVLRRHGVLFPANAFLHSPLLEAARGGSLLTGLGGDQIFLSWGRGQLAALLARRRRPVARDLRHIGYAMAPARVRRQVVSRRVEREAPSWLRPEARRTIASVSARELSVEPGSWRDWVPWRARRRQMVASCSSIDVLAKDAGTAAFHPLLEPRFLATVARAGGRFGFGDRAALMRVVFADVVPDELLARRTKAHFDEVLWRAPSREFARRWDGNGLDVRLVDPLSLRAAWLEPRPDMRSALSLQAAWLSCQGAAP
jgi:asparagine synthetase B (glutamine-hydrolysing)